MSPNSLLQMTVGSSAGIALTLILKARPPANNLWHQLLVPNITYKVTAKQFSHYLFFVLFETGSYVAQDGLELTM